LFFFTGNDFGDNIWATEQRNAGKSYEPIELNPESEIPQNRHKTLHDELQAIAPSKIISLGEVFEADIAAHYFPTDGHFTVNGNRLLADHLLKIIP